MREAPRTTSASILPALPLRGPVAALRRNVESAEIPLGRGLPSGRRLLGVCIGILLPPLLVAIVALGSLQRAWHMPLPSLLVDAWGRPSVAAPAAWSEIRRAGVDAACRVSQVGDEDVAKGPIQRTGARVYDAVRRAGSASIRLTLRCSNDALVTVDLAVIRLDAPALWLLFCNYAFTGVLMVCSGLLVVLLAGRRIGAKSYAVMCVTPCIFGLSMLDYHTCFTPFLIGAFFAGWAGASIGPLWVGVTFPGPEERSRGLLRGWMVVLLMCWLALSIWLVSAGLRGDGHTARRALVWIQILCSAALPVLLKLRGKQTEGRRRRELDSAFFGLCGIPLCAIGLLLVGGDVGAQQDRFLMALPMISLLMPLSIGYSLIRHNILDVPVVYSEKIFFWASGLLALILGGTATTFLSCLASAPGIGAIGVLAESHLRPLWLHLTFGGLISVLLWTLLYKLAQWYFCAGVRLFRPRIEQLNEALAQAREPRQIHDEVSGFVRRCMRNLGVSVEVLDPSLLPELPCPADAAVLLGQGQEVWTKDDPPRLLLPMRSQRTLRGVLRLEREDRGLYNRDDLVLLRSVASIGAQALDNARHLYQVEELRRDLVALTRNEKVRAMAYFSNEFYHEMSPSLRFLQGTLSRLQRGETLDAEALEILGDEVRRLDDMVKRVQHQRAPRLRLCVVNLAERTRRAAHLLRDLLEREGVRAHIDVPEGPCAKADPDMLLQILVNLLRNAVQAAQRSREVGVSLEVGPGDWALSVWDTGPGVPAELVGRLFHPGFTTREDGSGWGLFICQRMARDLGLSLGYRRVDGRTRFVLRLPPDAQVRRGAET